MPVLRIGCTEIPYTLRHGTGRQRRITVLPEQVDVVALATDSDDDVAGFLHRKRQWLFDAVRDMERTVADRHGVPRFLTGSKIPYRGRKMSLTVQRSDADRIAVSYRNGFLVDLPNWVGDETDRLVASELRHWLKRQVRRDVRATAADYAARFGLVPRSIRVADLANGWGSCGSEGTILVNWHLIFAPRKVLDYVVVHELAHLRHRSHGKEFWDFLALLSPRFEQAKIWLDANQHRLGSEFLSTKR